MNAGSHQTLALVLGVGFIALFVVLMWLVGRVSRAGGWADWGTPGRPIVVRSRGVSRLIGIGIALVGCVFVVWSWHDAQAVRFFSMKMAVLGPFFVGCGLWYSIEGPELPPQRTSALGWVLTLLGLGAGFLYAEFLRTGQLPFLG